MPLDPESLPRLLSLAVHELRTPVTVVSGYHRMLLREQAGPITDKQRRMLEEADRSFSRMAAIVEEISTLSKLEFGTDERAHQPVDVAGLLAELASRMHEGEDRGVRLELRGTDQPVMVTGDRPLLTTALRALMHSALRERGEGTVVADCATRVVDARGYAVVAFADEPLLPVLTKEISQNSFAFDRWRGGTGMALPIASRVIELHGGALWSAATADEIAALDADRRGYTPLSVDDRREYSYKRAASALRLPLRTQ